MILRDNNSDQYLIDWKNGNIQLGRGIGSVEFDKHLRYKDGEFTIINGLDNVGKTIFILWYFLVLSVKYDLKWCIWSGENKSHQLIRQLIQFYKGISLCDLTEGEILSARKQITHWFKFVDNKGFYKSSELYDVFQKSKCNGGLVDPFTGLNRDFTYAASYEFLNETRNFVNKSGMSIYVNTHPNTEASRRKYSMDHDTFPNYPMPPQKSESEGGQPFGNRPDNYLTLHRFVGHPEFKYKTLVYVRKIKDTETGGEPTAIDEFIDFDWNNGLGFTVNGYDPIRDRHLFNNINTNNEDIY